MGATVGANRTGVLTGNGPRRTIKDCRDWLVRVLILGKNETGDDDEEKRAPFTSGCVYFRTNDWAGTILI